VQGGGALFLLAKMGQNSIDDVLVLDTCNDSRRSTTATANFKQEKARREGGLEI
jgi:hypothetical protein